jgi:hypothetical protein
MKIDPKVDVTRAGDIWLTVGALGVAILLIVIGWIIIFSKK